MIQETLRQPLFPWERRRWHENFCLAATINTITPHLALEVPSILCKEQSSPSEPLHYGVLRHICVVLFGIWGMAAWTRATCRACKASHISSFCRRGGLERFSKWMNKR